MIRPEMTVAALSATIVETIATIDAGGADDAGLTTLHEDLAAAAAQLAHTHTSPGSSEFWAKFRGTRSYFKMARVDVGGEPPADLDDLLVWSLLRDGERSS